MVQILINLIAGALGGVGAGKASPNFDLGTIGNIISGLVGGGVLGQIATLALPSVMAAAQSGNLSVSYLTADRRWRWRGHTHGAHWCNQEQSCCLSDGCRCSSGMKKPLEHDRVGAILPWSPLAQRRRTLRSPRARAGRQCLTITQL